MIGDKSIQVINGDEGKRLRLHLDKFFTHEAVDSYIPTLLDIGQEIVDSWDKFLDGEKIPAREFFTNAALKAITVTCFGDYFLSNDSCTEFAKLYVVV
jgi:cytochrome P450